MQFGMDVFLGSFFPGNDHKSPVVRMGCAGDQGDEPISPLGSQAGLGAGCFLTGDLDLSVALGRVFLLRNQNLTADRALLTGSQAVLGAGRGHCRNFNFRMCLFGNGLLCNQNLATDRTLFALGQALFRAGSFSAGNGHLRVHAGCGNRNIVHEHLVTGRAVPLLYSAFYTGKHI